MNDFMSIAIEQAKDAEKTGEVPVGAAVFTLSGEIVSKAHNETIKEGNPCAHAEILAIKRAFEIKKTHRLDDCVMYVTLEPCTMCAGAIILARLAKVYFGAYDILSGAFGGKFDVAREINCSTEIYGGIHEEECSRIMSDFFRKRLR